MQTILFDTHAYIKKLKAVGFTEEQAEVQAETLAGLINDQLATKKDLKELEVILKRDLAEVEATFKRDLAEVEATLKRDLAEMELRLKYDITLRMGAMMAASIAIIAALVKLL